MDIGDENGLYSRKMHHATSISVCHRGHAECRGTAAFVESPQSPDFPFYFFRLAKRLAEA
jgi:hypothetical protein